MAADDVTIEILKDIRDGIRSTNSRLDTVDSTLTLRLGAVEVALLDLAEQQRFVVRYTRALAARETRVDKLESK